MSAISELLKERNIPDILTFANGEKVTADRFPERRKEMLEILEKEIYGTSPAAPKLTVTKADAKGKYSSFAGKAWVNEVTISFDTDNGPFSFTCVEAVPKVGHRVPVFVMQNFRPNIPDKYLPAEEIIDSECAFVRIYYNDIAFDGDDGFKSGIAAMYDRNTYTWGKLRMWAWAMSRVLDYLETTDYAELSRIAAVGHSRLGKTSLIAAAFDERFCMACANDSGCSGDAITRGKKGEHIAQITGSFPYWFCDKYKEYAGKEETLPFDQHYLVASIAPRYVSLGAALLDEWADPESQYLCACASSAAWELLGQKGFEHPDRLPKAEEYFEEGRVRFHLRNGEHFLSRTDWLVYLDSMKNIT